MSTHVPTGETPLELDELREFFAAGAKPSAGWKLGTEYEKFVVRPGTCMPCGYAEEGGIRALLEFLAGHAGWDIYEEHGLPIALTRDGATISLEPGGQLELSGAVFQTVHQTARELDDHVRELDAAAEVLDIGVLWAGVHPWADLDRFDWMPKPRYDIMKAYLATRGGLAHDMMKLTCTVQVNIDFSSEADALAKMRTSMAISPLVTAIFANSPLRAGTPTGYRSWRQHVWTDVDPDRTGLLPFVFEEGAPLFQRYIDWALEARMFFIHRGGRYIDMSGVPFGEFARHGHAGHRASEADWELHLSTLFPEVRLKRYIEVRSADSVPPECAIAAPALYKGLLYEQALRSAYDIIGDISLEQRKRLRDIACREGIHGEFEGRSLREMAIALIDESAQALRRIGDLDEDGRDESVYLEDLRALIAAGEDPGARLERLRPGGC